MELHKPFSVKIVGEKKKLNHEYCKGVFRDSTMQRDSLFIKLFLTPRCLGGIPISLMLDPHIRGFPDDLLFAIASLKIIHQNANGDIKLHIEKNSSTDS